MRRLLLSILVLASPTTALGQSYDLRANWSDTQNPAGPWSYQDGSQHLLPGIPDWDTPPSTLWAAPQPGWAVTRSGTVGSTPFIFRSNGSETFPHDWTAGDIVICSGDPGDASSATTPATIAFTSPLDGLLTFVGSLWAPASPNSFHYFSFRHADTALWNGAISEYIGQHPRASPLVFQVSREPVARNDVFTLSAGGTGSGSDDFVGVNLNVIVCIGITDHPGSTLACPRSTAHLSIAARTSYGTITYRWRKNGVPLLEGASGNRIHGVFSPTLSIDTPTAADNGMYDCVVGSVCSTIPSNAAALTVCPADFNCSGTLTIQDIFEYLNAWLAASPTAEFDNSPGLTTADLFAFISAWFTGC